MRRWDIFVSYASEDRESFVDPLARRLQQFAVRVWYDGFVLVPGDRLSEKIAEGLTESRCGLLVISRAFIGKRWPAYELSGLVNRFVEEKIRLIPVWLGVTRNDVSQLNPALADLFAIVGDPRDINSCALDVLRAVRPQLHENLTMLPVADLTTVEVGRCSIASLKDGPIRHHDLPASLLVRIQNVWFVLRDITTISLERSIENFQRDLRPEREVEIWERIVSALQIAVEGLGTSETDVKKRVLQILLAFSVGSHESVFKDADAGNVDEDILGAAMRSWLDAVPSVTVADVDSDSADA